ncbi:MAG: glycine cleavage system aminomethyltransferase GcvT [Actinomycetia bacterium]|nr:glycine cleavage system aminomethyltransferase GcvT [Actinomycetes bacterium]
MSPEGVSMSPDRSRRTPLHSRHIALGAKMVDFAGRHMPLNYPTGTVHEHLATRRKAGLFDVSHMGRFLLTGPGVLAFLQRVLSNNAAALDPGQAQYTFITTDTGGAVDDAYLYRFGEDEYLLVVNAANRDKDQRHLETVRVDSPASCNEACETASLHHLVHEGPVTLLDRSEELAMLALQGPASRGILEDLLETGTLPEPRRNELSTVTIAGTKVLLSRSGYTGEPLCFELFLPSERAAVVWDLLVEKGAVPCGLGARDTLRLEAALPLYGRELGEDPTGREIPLFSCPLAAFAVSFSPVKGDYVGREALLRQQAAYRRILVRDYSLIADLPRMTRPVALTGRGVARPGSAVYKEGRQVGWVTSGTMVPYWKIEGEGLEARMTEEHDLRSIGLALLDSDIVEDERLTVDIRGRTVEAVVVPYHLRSDAPPYARPIVYRFEQPEPPQTGDDEPARAGRLLTRALENHLWRQRECINLIPSEMTPSPLVRLLSVSDPAYRYAEHRKLEAFYDADVFYYQGTGFIEEVERLLETEICRFLGAAEVETRVVSGQMANAAVFSALVEYLNRGDPKSEPRRIPMVMNNHIGKGGHLSAQPMGALKDFVATDPRTDRPAVVNFPVLAENPYRIDVPATFELIDEYRPRLIIFGKSMVLHKEPVAEVRRFLDEQGLDAVVMYDMAHVLGLAGPHFQQPFAEGADLVTGSTHKTFFGTQRGIIAGRWTKDQERYDLWEAVRRRVFPGSVSNHHLGTLVGLLLATYEMNHFKDAYQTAVIANAKAFARALADAGLRVAGDPAIDFTETHQVVVEVGYGRGPEMARRLEENDIICNYQATPDEEGFTASGALRLGTAEMTRFGMGPADFAEVARLMAAVIGEGSRVAQQVRDLRRHFVDLQYCFREEDYPEVVARLRATL